ncbi:MAG: PQQ-like beta-propeller repeat protein [Proteobacteria bacterium]|nr:PQQ-like beta-propeller repeat protein [Pseudomonadota bacterium]
MVDNSYLLNLFGASSNSSAQLFAALYPQPSSTTLAAASQPSVTTSLSDQAKQAPTPPWLPSSNQPSADDLAKKVLAGHAFIDPSYMTVDNAKASADYGKLFELYQGLSAMSGLVTLAQAKGVTAQQLRTYETAFAKGISQIQGYTDTLHLDNVQIASGKTAPSLTSTAGVKLDTGQYVGPAIYQGDLTNEVPAFQGDVRFSMQAVKLNGPTTQVDFDLSEMGSTPRTMANVISYLNGKLADAGVTSRFGDKQLPAPPNTVTVGGKTVTLPDAPARWALSINASSAEKLTLSAPAASDAVYVTQSATTVTTSTTANRVSGTTTTTENNVTTTTTGSSVTTTTVAQQLLKFQTDNVSTAETPPDATPRPLDPLSVDGRAWSATLQAAVTNARATATGPDGSVYVLGDVDGSVSGQGIKGNTDVALFKYDAAGNLLYTRTLGAAADASGFGLAVASDGKVAIAGSVTGALDSGDAGVDAHTSDSFVTLLNANGDEMWTERRAARSADQANAVAFDASGNVYVAGKAQSPMPGAGNAVGGWDGYLEAFDKTGKALSTQQFGTSGSDSAVSLAVNGSSVLVGSVDDGHAVVRNFDMTTATAPNLSQTYDLGDLQGGNLAGIAINNGKLVVAGTAHNSQLGGASAVNASSGGSDVFVATLDPTLSDHSGDKLAWYGGSGDDSATAMAVANGKIYVTGKTSSDLPGTTPIGKQDGFIAEIDPNTGNSNWTERFSGPGGKVAPSAITVASGGASVLDRLGLPMGSITTGDSQLLTSGTALRAGDQFFVQANSGPKTKITIDPNETLLTLSQKIQRATGFRATVTMSGGGGIEKLMIKPSSKLSSITLSQGAAGRDALAPMGLQPGIIAATPDPKDTSAKPLSGLDLSNTLSLSNPDAIANAQTVINQALSTVRVAYQAIVKKNQPPQQAAQNNGGAVPQYLQDQIANYQAALARLGG